MKQHKNPRIVLKTIIALLILLSVGLISYNLYPVTPLDKNAKVDKLVVYKSKRTLSAYSKGKLLKSYPISLGGQPVGAKEIEGDLKTPEGHYTINDKNPYSDYHKTSVFPILTKRMLPMLKVWEKMPAATSKFMGLETDWDLSANCSAAQTGHLAVWRLQIRKLTSFLTRLQ